MDTIFALSSGRPPAAIAIVRVSGPATRNAVIALAGAVPPARHASLRTLRDRHGQRLDRALVLHFPAPDTATGEDLAEFHLHGGRAVVAAVEGALAVVPGLRRARAGEFTRRALENGRIDLAQAQGLADLLAAETEGARRAALAATEGLVSRTVRTWLDELSSVAALIESALDFSDEDDVGTDPAADVPVLLCDLIARITAALARPTVERVGTGPLIVLAGPPNSGKSSLFNAMVEREAAIISPIAGTTRDLIEAIVVRNGASWRLVDTAGLAIGTGDPIERIGIERAEAMMAHADTILWLGEPDAATPNSIKVHSRADMPDRSVVPTGSIPVTVHDLRSLDALWSVLTERHRDLATFDEALFHEAQRAALTQALNELKNALTSSDLLIVAEQIRLARTALATLLGVDATEAMLDALFARFCIGK